MSVGAAVMRARVLEAEAEGRWARASGRVRRARAVMAAGEARALEAVGAYERAREAVVKAERRERRRQLRPKPRVR